MRASDVRGQDITAAAEALGLDPGPIIVEEVPPEVIYRIAAYGAPRNYAHWSFGRDYWVQKRGFDQGRSKIYEVILPDDPAVAYISTDNTPAQNLLVRSHILGHADLFRHNEPSRIYQGSGYIQGCANARKRFLEYENLVGPEALESVIDLAHSLKHHSIPVEAAMRAIPVEDLGHLRRQYRDIPNQDITSEITIYEEHTRDYIGRLLDQRKRALGIGETDLLLWLSEYPQIPDWQRDVFSTVREQWLYHRGIRLTKIVHEGFSAWVELKVLKELGIDNDEYLDIIKLHANIAAPYTTGINPYALGFRIFRHLEERGLNPIELAHKETDSSLIRNYFDAELIEAVELYGYVENPDVVSHLVYNRLDHVRVDWKELRDALVAYCDSRLNYAATITIVNHFGIPMRNEVPVSLRQFIPDELPGKDMPSEATRRLVSRKILSSFVSPGASWKQVLKSNSWQFQQVEWLPDEMYLTPREGVPFLVLEMDTRDPNVEIEMASAVQIIRGLGAVLRCMVAILLVGEDDGKRYLIDMKATAIE